MLHAGHCCTGLDGGRTRLFCLKVGGKLHPFFLSVCSLPTGSLSLAKTERQPLVANCGVSGASSLLSREVGGDCVLC